MAAISARISTAALVAIGVAACETHKENLLFASSDTLGVSIASSSTDTTPEFTVGYKGHDIAIIPAYATNAEGEPVVNYDGELQTVGSLGEGVEPKEDSYSVFGNFGVNTPVLPIVGNANNNNNTANNTLGLTKFFATGIAAQVLAGGFACNLAMGPVRQEPKAAYYAADCAAEVGAAAADGEASGLSQPPPPSGEPKPDEPAAPPADG